MKKLACKDSSNFIQILLILKKRHSIFGSKQDQMRVVKTNNQAEILIHTMPISNQDSHNMGKAILVINIPTKKVLKEILLGTIKEIEMECKLLSMGDHLHQDIAYSVKPMAMIQAFVKLLSIPRIIKLSNVKSIMHATCVSKQVSIKLILVRRL